MPTRKLLLVYACISAVYLLYLPSALPVLDNWTMLQIFHQARGAGISRSLLFLRQLADNTWWGQFRLFWAGYVPVYAVSFLSDFVAWPYCLLAWTAHLFTAFLLCRTVTLLSGDSWSGFAAGAFYSVFPAVNNTLFWPLPEYYFQAWALAWWFYYTWKKLVVSRDCRYRWKDLAALLPVVFSGEHILPAVALLLPITGWLFGEPDKRRALLRFGALHLAAVGAWISLYVVLINRVPIRQTFESRYSGGARWSPWPFAARLLASLGLKSDLAEWRPAWRFELALAALLALAAAAYLWGQPRKTGPARQVRLLLWSLAGAALTYLPVSLLPGFEWRYLYVPAAFLVSGGVAILGLLNSPTRTVLAFFAVAYGLALSYFEMRQCWIPQSREAQAILDAVAGAGPVANGEAFIFSHAPYSMGPAPSFIAGSSWSLKAMLEHCTHARDVQGAREVLVNEQGELALYNRDKLSPFARRDIPRLRVFVRDTGGRFLPKSLLALPVAGERFQLRPLRPGPSPGNPLSEPLPLEKLKSLPQFNEIYFPHPHSGPLPHA